MKESYGEGVAIHTGPESCTLTRKGLGEALTGVRAGRVFSREILLESRVPTLWDRWKATLGVSLARDTLGPCAVADLGTYGNTSHGNREIPYWPSGRGSGGHVGKSEDTSR